MSRNEGLSWMRIEEQEEGENVQVPTNLVIEIVYCRSRTSEFWELGYVGLFPILLKLFLSS